MNYDMFDIDELLEKLKIEYTKKTNKISELIKQNINNNKSTHEFVYSIDKQTFVDTVKAVLALHDWIDDCYDLGINFDNCMVLTDLEKVIVDLLSKCCNDSMEESDVVYFMYDLNGGKAFLPEDIMNVHSPEEFWDWLVDKKRGIASSD